MHAGLLIEQREKILFLGQHLRQAGFEALRFVLCDDVCFCRFVHGLIDGREFCYGVFPFFLGNKLAIGLYRAFIGVFFLDIPFAPRFCLPKRLFCG